MARGWTTPATALEVHHFQEKRYVGEAFPPRGWGGARRRRAGQPGLPGGRPVPPAWGMTVLSGRKSYSP